MTAPRASTDARKAILLAAAITGAAVVFLVPVGAAGEAGVRLLASGRDFGLFGLAVAAAIAGAWAVSAVGRGRPAAIGVMTGMVGLLLAAIILLRIRDGLHLGLNNPFAYLALAVIASIFWRALSGMALGASFAWRVLVPLIFGVFIF